MSVLWRAGLALALLVVLVFGVLAPPERCPAVSPGELRRSAQAASDWLIRNQDADGTWLYQYDERDDSVVHDYNLVRHAGVIMALYQAAAAGLPGAQASADRGTEWARDNLLERDGWAAFASPDRVATGASALLIAGLVTRREETGDERYDALLRRLGRFVLAQTEPSGAVLASYDPAKGAPVPGEYSKYFTGEAYLAFARLDRAFPDEGWDEPARRVGAYLATSRDEDEDHRPPIPDHWAAYGMAEAGLLDAGYARRQAELFGLQVRLAAQRFGPWGALVRGGYVPRGGGYGVIGEALTGLWLVARDEPRLADLRGPLADRATCIAGLAVSAQSDRDDAAGAARPERVEGAWFRDGETRMDDQQHALAALLRTIPIAEADARDAGSADESPDLGTAPDARDPDGADELPDLGAVPDARDPDGAGELPDLGAVLSARDAGGGLPLGWLWAAVLVLALNPPRAAFGVPREGRPPREVAGVAALGGLIGGLVVCVAAAAGDPLLDALDVSAPSFRIAAGIVAAGAGVADIFRRPPSPEPALPGRRAALVPVAIPLVARPVLLVLALGAGADSGVPMIAAAMAVAVVLFAVLAATAPFDGPRSRTLRWAVRLLAAALLACGLILTVDGLLDV
jgi:small neutral amino acid transporter SnatA (MarC family)